MYHQGGAAVRQDMKSLLLVLTASVCLQAAAQVQSPDAFEQNRRLGRGVNIIGYDKGPADSRVRYTDHVARTAEAAGWSWAYWQFDSDFILWDMKRDAWVEPILHALIPPKN